jgi:hypothetical protein
LVDLDASLCPRIYWAFYPNTGCHERKNRLKPSIAKILGKIFLLLIGIAIGLSIFEIYLRFSQPYAPFVPGNEMPWMRDELHYFLVDPDFGFRPILGKNYYNEYGTMVNSYPIEKNEKQQRLLFLGDSVTRRAKIIEALEAIYGKESYQYWNAGVESFNTVQEVGFYKRFNHAVRPDHVILTFLDNDFGTTPVAFSSNGKLLVYAPEKPVVRLWPWLFSHSHLYRFIVGSTMARRSGGVGIYDEVRSSLRELRDLLDRDGIRLTVLLLPVLQPLEKWSDRQLESRLQAISMLDELHIRYFDLLEPMNEAIKESVNIQEKLGDTVHPSREVSIFFARYLQKNRLLD